MTIFALGPALVLCLTALLGFLAQEKKRWAMILVGGMVFMILAPIIGGEYYYVIYWLLMLALVFMPYLIQRRLQAEKAGQQA